MIQPKRLVVCILIIMVVLNTPIVFAAGLQDVEDTKYEEAVEYLRLKGIMKGYPDGTFRPDDCITRAEFAVIAVLTKGLSSAETVQDNGNMGNKANSVMYRQTTGPMGLYPLRLMPAY